MSLVVRTQGGDYDTCVTAVMNVCINHVDVDPADEGFCEACLFDLADGEIGSACMDWFDAFYAKVRLFSEVTRLVLLG